MPIYEFRCLKCGHIFEKLFVKADDRVELHCPQCKSDAFERVISSTNHFMKSGGGSATSKPKYETKTCSPGNSCSSFELPGPDD